MLFNKLVEEVGFGPAVVLCENDLPDNFWDGLDFEQWKEIEHASFGNWGLNKQAIEGMLRTATSCKELDTLSKITQCDPPFNQLVKKMFRLAKTPEDRKITIKNFMDLLMYDHTRTISKSEQQTLLAACDFDELYNILLNVINNLAKNGYENMHECKNYISFVKNISSAIANITTDFSQYERIKKQDTSLGRNAIYHFVLPAVLKKLQKEGCGNFTEWWTIYDGNADLLWSTDGLGSKVATIAYRQTCKLAKTLRDWWQIYLTAKYLATKRLLNMPGKKSSPLWMP